MPVEIQITKEIGNYEPKFIGPLTVRQTICVAVAAPLCILIYTAFSPVLSQDMAIFLCAPFAGAAALFGWVRPYGMKTEEFVRSVFINMVLAPNKRKYKTENHFELLCSDKLAARLEMSEEELEESRRQEQQEETRERFNRKKKHKKYKLSSEAVK